MNVMDPRLRIGEAEREQATAQLARHYGEGRLDHDEYCERLDAVWTARTSADLALLFTDLPRLPVAPPQAFADRNRRPPSSRFPWLPAMLVLLALSVLLEAPVWLLVVPWWLLWRRRRRAQARERARPLEQGPRRAG